MNAATLVQKLWNYCNVLRDDVWVNLKTLSQFG